MEENGLNAEGQARRRFLKQAGTVAWATPFIVTMMSRTAHAQGGAECGQVDLDPSICVVTTPCGSTEQCVPNPNPLGGGNCICVTTPSP